MPMIGNTDAGPAAHPARAGLLISMAAANFTGAPATARRPIGIKIVGAQVSLRFSPT